METVEQTFVRTTTTLHHLTIAGHTVTTTSEHPFMVARMGWIQAADLRVGDRLVTTDEPDVTAGERTVTLDAIRIETLDDAGPVTVYNIHVHTHHTYYVLAGDLPVLVHNSGAHGGAARYGDGSWFPERSLPRDANGRNLPDSPYPHTQLGRGRKGTYPAAREFDEEGEVVRDIHWTDHGRPGQHTNPHQHPYTSNSTGGTRKRGSAEPLEDE